MFQLLLQPSIDSDILGGRQEINPEISKKPIVNNPQFISGGQETNHPPV